MSLYLLVSVKTQIENQRNGVSKSNERDHFMAEVHAKLRDESLGADRSSPPMMLSGSYLSHFPFSSLLA